MNKHFRIAVLITTFFLGLQTLCMFKYDEPYPAIIMPGFEGSGGYRDGVVKVKNLNVVFKSIDREFSFTPQELLSEFPDSHHGRIASVAFELPGEKPPQGVPSRLGKLRDFCFPGYSTRYNYHDSPIVAESLREWLRKRSMELLPGKSISSVEFRWHLSIFQFYNDSLYTSHTPLGIKTVTLQDSQK